MELAEQQGMDLVEVAPNADPPVCRVMDYGKYMYELSKKEREAKKKHHTTQVKEIKLRPRIDDHDFEFKQRHARRFLQDRDKVKFTLVFRGREMTHTELGREVLERMVRELEDIGQIESEPRMEGATMVVIIAPTSRK